MTPELSIFCEQVALDAAKALLISKENAPKWRKRLDAWNIIEPVELPDGSFFLDDDIFLRVPKLREMVDEREVKQGKVISVEQPQ